MEQRSCGAGGEAAGAVERMDLQLLPICGDALGPSTAQVRLHLIVIVPVVDSAFEEGVHRVCRPLPAHESLLIIAV